MQDTENIIYDRCVLSHDSDGRRVADLWLNVDVEYLQEQYKWLCAVYDKQMEAKETPCDELEGLLHMLEAMLGLIDEATGTEEEA